MELTKRTKVAGGVLALGLAALAWDRWSAPASASAATEATPAGTTAAGTATATPAPASKAGSAEQQLHQGALADRLEQLSMGAGPRSDAFAAPMEWFPEPVVAKPVKPKPENTPVDLSRHVLSTVMEMPGRAAIAVVDKHRLCVGEKWAEGDLTIELLDASKKDGGWAKVRINGREGELRVQNAKKAEGTGGS